MEFAKQAGKVRRRSGQANNKNLSIVLTNYKQIVKENLFKSSLLRNETALFFEGEGEYFSRNREDHGHSYVTHMTGWVAKYIDNDPDKFNIVLEELSKFLEDKTCKPDFLFPINMNLIGLSRLLKNKPYTIDSANKSTSENFYSSVSRFYKSLPAESINVKVQKRVITSISDCGCINLAKTIDKALK